MKKEQRTKGSEASQNEVTGSEAQRTSTIEKGAREGPKKQATHLKRGGKKKNDSTQQDQQRTHD